MKGETNWLGVVIVLVIIGVLTGFISVQGFSTQKGPTLTAGSCSTALAASCSVNPSISASAVDILQPSTTITPNIQYSLNGALLSSAPTTQGTVLAIVGANGYINTTSVSFDGASCSSFTLTCNSHSLSAGLYKYGAGSLSIYTDAQTATLNNTQVSAGVTNESVKYAVGSTYNWKIIETEQALRSTGPQYVVAEFSAPSGNISTVTLAGCTPQTAVTNGYTRQATNGAAYAFICPAATNGAQFTSNLQAVATSTGVIGQGNVYTTWYALQPFFDTNGQLNSGTVPFDASNTRQHAGSQAYIFYIKN